MRHISPPCRTGRPLKAGLPTSHRRDWPYLLQALPARSTNQAAPFRPWANRRTWTCLLHPRPTTPTTLTRAHLVSPYLHDFPRQASPRSCRQPSPGPPRASARPSEAVRRFAPTQLQPRLPPPTSHRSPTRDLPTRPLAPGRHSPPRRDLPRRDRLLPPRSTGHLWTGLAQPTFPAISCQHRSDRQSSPDPRRASSVPVDPPTRHYPELLTSARPCRTPPSMTWLFDSPPQDMPPHIWTTLIDKPNLLSRVPRQADKPGPDDPRPRCSTTHAPTEPIPPDCPSQFSAHLVAAVPPDEPLHLHPRLSLSTTLGPPHPGVPYPHRSTYLVPARLAHPDRSWTRLASAPRLTSPTRNASEQTDKTPPDQTPPTDHPPRVHSGLTPHRPTTQSEPWRLFPSRHPHSGPLLSHRRTSPYLGRPSLGPPRPTDEPNLPQPGLTKPTLQTGTSLPTS